MAGKKLSKGLAAIVAAAAMLGSASCYTDYFVRKEDSSQHASQKVNETKRSKLAVLLIDMQDSFLGGIRPEEREREIPYQLEVLEHCRQNGVPVIVLEYEKHGPTTKALKDKVESLKVKDYIVKSQNDGFVDTCLEEKLKGYGAETVLLMGVNASACVISTAEGALNAGFKIMASKDLMADDCYWFLPGEMADWYKEMGIYRDSYKDILELLKGQQPRD